MTTLVVKTGPRAGQRVSVDREAVVGRREGDLVIEDLEVSRRHAVIRARDGIFEIEDLDSTNGTFVNGKRVDGPTPLSPGDAIRLGQTTLELEEEWRAADTMVTPVLGPEDEEGSGGEDEPDEPAAVSVVGADREAAPPNEPDVEEHHVTERLPTMGVAPGERPRRSRRVWAAAAVAVVALVAATVFYVTQADEPSRADFIAAADDVCRQAQVQLDGVDLDRNPSRTELRRDLDTMLSVRRETLADIRALDRPQGMRGLVRFFVAYEGTNEAIGELDRLASRGGSAALLDAAQDLRAAGQAERSAARAFGFQVCGGL